MPGYTDISVSFTLTPQCDANGVMALQEWGILSCYHSEAKKQHRKILPCAPHVLPCDSLVLQSQLSIHNIMKKSPKSLSILAHRLPP